MKKLAALFLGVCAVIPTVNAQFIREYHRNPSQPIGFDCVAPVDDSPSSNLYVVANYGAQMLFSEIQQNGTEVWSKRLMVNDPDFRVNSMFVDAEGNVVMAGGESIGVDDDAYGFVAKFNPATKSMVWFRQVETSIWFFDITEGAAGGSYYVSGQEEDQGTGNQADLVVYSINRNTGDMTMITNLNKNVNETGECIIYNPNTASVYVAGRCELESGASKFRICLTKLDTLGNVQFSKFYVKSLGSTARMYGRDMILDDTTIVIVGFGDDAGTSTFKNLYFLRIGLDGTILNTKEYDITTASTDGVLASVKAYSDGYVLYGHGYSVSDEDVFLLNVNKTGDLNWAKTYPYKRNVNPSGFDFVGSLAIVGSNIFHVGQRTMLDGSRRGILMSVPVLTGEVGTCDNDLSVTTTTLTNYQASSGLVNCTFSATFNSLTIASKNMVMNNVETCGVITKNGNAFDNVSVLTVDELNVYPNPAFNSITISDGNDIKERLIIVTNINGATVYRNENAGTETTIDCNNWSSGLYTITLRYSDGSQTSTQFVRE